MIPLVGYKKSAISGVGCYGPTPKNSIYSAGCLGEQTSKMIFFKKN
jgi:hypothetical protein